MTPIAVGIVVALVLASACSSNSESGDRADATTSTAAAPSTTAGSASTRAPATTAPLATPSGQPAPAVTRIEVDSTPDQYFVLYIQPDLNAAREYPVAVTRGQAGKTALTDGRTQLPTNHYRVATFSIAQPGDIDGDGIDDITELNARTTMNPLNPARSISPNDGMVMIPDKATFEALSYQGKEVAIDNHLTDLEFVKFYLLDVNTDRPSVYFMNTVTHRAHMRFANAVGIPAGRGLQSGQMRGEIVYHRNVRAPDGTLGVYRFEFEPNDSYSFPAVRLGYELLASSMPFLTNNFVYYPMPQAALPLYQRERAQYDAYRMRVVLESDLVGVVDHVSLNPAVGYGLLRVMTLEERPNSRDVVIYEALPNEMPRVAGVITTVPQTPLSHVNLRAVQDRVPNAYVRNALDNPSIAALIGRYVKYTVSASGFTVEPATQSEVEAHHAAARPSTAQVPVRDLSVKSIAPLSKIGFNDSKAYGVKAANVATLATFGLPAGTVPSGYAVPFYFYDEFMKANGFYDTVREMLADPRFRSDLATQESWLGLLREAIKDAPMPGWMMTQLAEMQKAYPAGTSIRCRSSTNNEDLPNFSGAGLYDSKTQHADEGHIAKCIKQVYASTWNFRAFTEREFYRIDHLTTAMGVLTHPNFDDEVANGVAVSTDPLHGSTGTFYVNTQLGEDLVTNPDALSIPEELLLDGDGTVTVVRRSNLIGADRLLMTDARIVALRSQLKVIHDRFAVLYGVKPGDSFAIEIEFKITRDNALSIKQARPWVFN
ncbi:MAG: PEP/pyruvate-binding domain-containing protein [Acidimicrobiales bacterium]